jgi:sigma-B regulation protein RsbU (phosphoserine phosphatase)
MNAPFRLLRRKISAAGLIPRGMLARITLYLCGIVALLLVGEALVSMFGAGRLASSLSGWGRGLSFPAVLLALVLLFRFVRQRVLWRLRNRLIVTYVFIGVIPVVLLLIIFGLAGYFLAGQFATFLATADLRSQVSSLAAANNEIAAQVAAELRNGVLPDRAAERLRLSDRLAQEAQRSVSFWFRGREYVVRSARASALASAPPPWITRDLTNNKSGEFHDIAAASAELRLVALRAIPVGADRVIVASSDPFDSALVTRIAQGLGSIAVYRPGGESEAPLARGGSLPAPQNYFDGAFSFATPLQLRDWQTGADRTGTFLLFVTTRNSLLYSRLGATLGEVSNYILIALFVVAGFFAVIELVALLVGVRLTRTVTLSVSELYKSTQAVNRGDFTRRIPIRSADQLAALEGSFNSMTTSLQKLLAEQKEKQRIESELAIAQEVQNQLFPHEVAQLKSLELYGVCRPARTVSGDYYDFLPLAPEQVAIAVGDISGKGISAALLMATLHSAVRSFLVLHSREVAAQPALAAAVAGMASRRTSNGDGCLELAPAQWLELLNTHLYRSTPQSKYATLFVGEYNGATRQLTYSNGGHLTPLIISPDGRLRRLEAGGMVIGLFDNMQYEQESVELSRGDIFLAYSDGITEPENEFGEFGEDRLIDLVREHAAQPLERIADETLTAVTDWIGGAEQPDDMTVVLARAR